MPFEFRFGALLELRRQERDEAGIAVGHANAAIAKVHQQIDVKELERVSLRDGSDAHRQGMTFRSMLSCHWGGTTCSFKPISKP